MSLCIASVASGSNGNCYYIGNDQEAVLIDAGISCRAVERRMKSLGLQMERVKAIFISHEHGDHISGVPVLAKKWKLPVYITTTMLQSGRLFVNRYKTAPFRCSEAVAIGGLTVMPFFKHHDACDPHSFTVSGNGVTIGIFTDIGQPCDKLIHHFRRCNAAFLESNYDTDMLMNGRYPYHLKQRISGGKGHLSNRQALELFMSHRSSVMTHLLLSHLSKENNTPELALEAFLPYAGATKVVVASRYEAVGPYEIHAALRPAHFADRPLVAQEAQLALF